VPKDAGKVRVRTVLSKGKPAEEISALADRELVDLVVMGSAKGVVTNKVIRMTNRPVMAVSTTPAKASNNDLQKLNTILVATDFSEHSKKIVNYAFDLKRIFGASIYMLYVIETTRAIEFAIRQGQFTDTMEKMRQWAEHQLINLTPDEFVKDPTVVRLVEAGSPGDTIADVAVEVRADLTILGTHDYGTIHKHFIGTTTYRLLPNIASRVLTLRL
jgi:nucleotide-binding universal stress UspA family protein